MNVYLNNYIGKLCTIIRNMKGNAVEKQQHAYVGNYFCYRYSLY